MHRGFALALFANGRKDAPTAMKKGKIASIAI
jgi:hypothetical protein